MSGKKALCVGINQYKNFPSNNLQGCVNDVMDMTDILKKFLGFGDADIVTLTDAKATKANIMKALREMVDGAKSGKYTYLVYSQSGHGTQVPDKDGDEADRADEAFCPYDLAQKGALWDPAHIITDDELHDLFAQLPPTVLLEVCLDTCHSGTGIKAIDLLFDRRPKYLPPPSLVAFEKTDGKTPRSLFRALTEKGIVHHTLWAACRDNQTSADAQIGGSWHGAFTYCFCKAMRDSKNKISRARMLVKVNQCLKAGKYTQVAQLECEATKRGKNIG
jgi:hypothetical protein